ncbi:MAG: DUF192 domain-containing protein [Myxococcales bacterium]|nr:DUF192 domain-containing protein [Myxococcales bacterium]
MSFGLLAARRRILGLGLALAWLALAHAGSAAPSERVMLRGVAFDLELAADPSKRTIGLMFRDSIDDRGGMLFVFPDVVPRTFWMRNCLVDMDLLFLDARGRVVAVHEMQAEPLRRPEESEPAYLNRLRRYPSGEAVRFAIELKAGTARQLGLRIGTRVDLQRVSPAAN